MAGYISQCSSDDGLTGSSKISQLSGDLSYFWKACKESKLDEQCREGV